MLGKTDMTTLSKKVFVWIVLGAVVIFTGVLAIAGMVSMGKPEPAAIETRGDSYIPQDTFSDDVTGPLFKHNTEWGSPTLSITPSGNKIIDTYVNNMHRTEPTPLPGLSKEFSRHLWEMNHDYRSLYGQEVGINYSLDYLYRRLIWADLSQREDNPYNVLLSVNTYLLNQFQEKVKNNKDMSKSDHQSMVRLIDICKERRLVGLKNMTIGDI